MTTKEIINNIEKVRYYFNEQSFKCVCKDFGLEPSLYEDFKKGIYFVAQKHGDEVLEKLAKIGQQLERIGYIWTSDERPNIEKVIWKDEEGNIGSLVVDFHRYEGAKSYCQLLEERKSIRHFLKLCGKFKKEGKKEYTIIWEGDIWLVDDWGEEKAVMAFYEGEGSYFKYLLWTKEYGFLSPDGEPHVHGQKLTFNTKGKKMNVSSIGIGKSQCLLCNVHEGDLTALMPSKRKSNK